LQRRIHSDTVYVVNTILRTAAFDAWLAKLKDPRGKARIIERIRSVERGHFGDCQAVGLGVSEMRIHAGPGYRVYFTRTGTIVYVLLCGGTKRGQNRDIAKAQAMAAKLNEGSP
jgi:putative addiction module killer protein